MTPEDMVSKFDPSFTAFLIPNGIEIRYANKVDHKPKEIDTGSLSITRSITF